jgi:hypothetical protein
LEINTACWQIYEGLKLNPATTDAAWRELCYSWSSDFRTHITNSRWEKYRTQLAEFSAKHPLPKASAVVAQSSPPTDRIRLTRDKRFLKIETDAVKARLDCHKGMALDALVFKALSPQPLCGTLPHGYYDDISRAADYYTGHLVFEGAGVRKVTDLESCEPTTAWVDDRLEVSANIATALGNIRKVWTFQTDAAAVGLRYELNWSKPLLGSLRLGHVTLMPQAFAKDSLFYATHNGGKALEKFTPTAERIEHGRPVSFLVSASHALGVTNGLVELGDGKNVLQVHADKSAAAVVGMVSYHPLKDTYFYRLAFSAREMDETSKPADASQLVCAFSIDARTVAPE